MNDNWLNTLGLIDIQISSSDYYNSNFDRIFDRILQYSSMLVFILVYFVQNDLIMNDSKHFLSHFEDRWGFFWTLCASFGIFNCCFRVFHSIFIVFHFIFIFLDLYLLFLKAIHGDSKTQFKNSASIL